MGNKSDLLFAELARREQARRNYRDYLAYVHGRMWVRTRLSDFLAETAQRFIVSETSNAYDILVVETPPQHGKSMSITETLPSWYLGKWPDDRVIIAGYNDDFAERFNRRNKEKVKTHGPNLFGRGVGAIDRANEFEIEGSTGRLISRGMMSGITGNPANFVIIDDPIKNREEADSPTRRTKLWEEWQNSIKTRLSAGAKIILIMTPWHEDDLRARILASETNVTHIRIPVEAQANDPLGRLPGEPLCPELGKDAAWLADFKESYINDPQGGARAWSALYMCNPRVEGGNLVRRDWWRYYDPKKIHTFGSELISVDATFKGNENNDYVAITVWGKLENDYYLRYCLKQHLDFPGTLDAIRAVRRLYPRTGRVLIEDKANGSAIIQTLQSEMVGVIGVNPKGGKVARVNAVSPAIESGHVYLPEGEPWVTEYVDEWTAFPAGEHDDMVDSSSQALSHMLFSSGYVDRSQPTEEEQFVQREETAFLNSESLFDVYSEDMWGLMNEW